MRGPLSLVSLALLAISISACQPPPLKGKKQRNRVIVTGLASTPTVVDPISSEEQTPFSQLPLRAVEVRLTLTDSETGAVKKIAHIIGESSLDLSGVPDGNYSLLAETVEGGFRSPAPQNIVINNGKFEDVELKFEKIEKDYFYYYWESDHEGREFEYSVNEDVAPRIEFLDESIEVNQSSSSQTLQGKYNIVLGDTEDLRWNYDLATKVLRAVDSIPHDRLRRKAKFILARDELHNDIQFAQTNGHYTVKISLQAFAYASEKLVKLNGRRGKFFSHRLFNALVNFFTDDGTNASAVAKILEDKFAVTTTVPNYKTLTSTGEPASHFQGFKPKELVQLINAFAEMPSGFYKIAGLRYLLRRLDGHPHPLYPQAAAVAWPRGADSDSYIEFMDVAFISQSKSDTHRLILHEKSHFLWANVFSKQLKDDWIELGNWFENETASSGWSTTDTTAFVSAYAHAKNPNEDVAESIAYYVLNPNYLLSRGKKKFDFIEQRIMNGHRYVSSIREDLTFEVLNLFPDYDYPGKIRRVEVAARGGPRADKTVSITIELADKEGIKDGASLGFTRITSPNKTSKDVYLYPVDGNGHLLRGNLTIPNTAKSGYWTIQNISITDTIGNERHEGIIDFGFKLFINNSVEDNTPPKYVADSMSVTSTEKTRNGRQIFNIDIKWKIDENMAMRSNSPAYANMISPDHAHLYRITKYGRFDHDTKEAHVRLTLTEHHPVGRYGISYINMIDRALNMGQEYFSDDPEQEDIRYVTIDSDDPDTNKPELDPNKITIEANPLNPEAPDGSTNVVITFYAKDDKSGLGLVYYKLMDPLGKVHFNYFYHPNSPNSDTLFYNGDPTEEKEYNIRATLPKGSPSGRWGLFEIVLHDKAGNVKTYNFLETIHFSLE